MNKELDYSNYFSSPELLANAILKHITNISGLVQVPIIPALILVGVSMLLTVISGLIPAKMASKKDPVIALRTE